ncbi:MAG: D-glycerate dehydrogenase, partial [Polyangiaceae bacterium]
MHGARPMSGNARVVATWPLSELAVQRLREVADRIEDISNEKLSSEELAQRLHDADGLIIFPLTTRIDSTVLAGANRLKVVATVAVGYDNVDLRACAERGIKVGNTPGVIAP